LLQESLFDGTYCVVSGHHADFAVTNRRHDFEDAPATGSAHFLNSFLAVQFVSIDLEGWSKKNLLGFFARNGVQGDVTEVCFIPVKRQHILSLL
jgi:hypothetical protein